MSHAERDVILQVENLSKYYGSFTAVNNISFAIYRGEVLGFLGPNGAGKSTTIDLITTLQKPSKGEISYPGLANNDHPHIVRQHIGIVPQELAIYGNLSVRDNLVYIGKMYGLQGKSLTARINTLLTEFDLEEKAKARARTLSGGQKRRLNFAMADIHKPSLVVLDEPTVGLDPNARTLVWQIIQGYHQAGKTVLLTTHYMEEAETLCNRIILIDCGSLVTQGSPVELKASLSNEVVLDYQIAGLVSSQTIEELKLLTGVKMVSNEGNSLRIVLARFEVEAIKVWLAGKGLVITGMHTDDISLEDVFRHYTGRNLREESNVTVDHA